MESPPPPGAGVKLIAGAMDDHPRLVADAAGTWFLVAKSCRGRRTDEAVRILREIRD